MAPKISHTRSILLYIQNDPMIYSALFNMNKTIISLRSSKKQKLVFLIPFIVEVIEK